MWEKTKIAFESAFNWTLRYPLALLISIIVVAVAVLFLFFGVGDVFNVGGIIGKLFGKDDTDGESEIEIANKVPPNRVDKEGKPLPLEEKDEEGWAQQSVSVIDRSSNPFRDQTKVVVQTEEGVEKKLRLPIGVKDTDVKQVIEVKPKVYKVIVKAAPKKADEDLINYLES